MTQTIRIVALGGLGEVGMNCLVLESEGRMLVIDCGVTFPDWEPGIDVIHPDFGYILDRAGDLEAVVLTHGHEDHIGALPYLLQEAPAPVYGPEYALSLVSSRLPEFEFPDAPRLIPIRPRTPFEAGPFRITPYRVTHSIPDSTGLAIDTPAGTIIHSGDFKIEEDPLDGEHFDSDFLTECGDRGVRLLLSDSTNSENEGEAGGERGVVEALDRRMAQAEGRVAVCMFASNTIRLDGVFELAKRHGRRVLLLGRSLRNHFAIASELSILPHAPAALVSEDDALDVPPRELLLVTTGSQAEPGSALHRLAFDTNPKVHLEHGDEVVMSSRIIPGRERAVHEMLVALERTGVRVWTRRDDAALHVSGHACRGEQQRLLELTRPDTFVPVHGTLVHLKRHEMLARSLGIDDTLAVENGTVVELSSSGLRVAGRIPTGRVHRQGRATVPTDVLRERLKLSRAGVVSVGIRLDGRGRVAGEPSIELLGVLSTDHGDELSADLRRAILRALSRRTDTSTEVTKAAVAQAVRRVFRSATGLRPLVHTVVARPDP